MAHYFELRADRIVLWPLGGLAQTSPGRNAREEILVAVAGPAMHIPIALAIAAYLEMHGAQLSLWDFNPFSIGSPHVFGVLQVALYEIMRLQVDLFCFNLFLPAYPMDGGRVLVAVLSGWVSRETTARLSMLLSAIIGIWLWVQFDSMLIGMLLLGSAVMVLQALQAGQIDYHPMFAFNPSRPTARKFRKSKPTAKQKAVILQFRPREVSPEARTCPHCQRAVPDKAMMCGFCEREV